MNELYLWVPCRGWKLIWKGRNARLGHEKQAELYPLETKYFYHPGIVRKRPGCRRGAVLRRVSYRGHAHQMYPGEEANYDSRLETYTPEGQEVGHG